MSRNDTLHRVKIKTPPSAVVACEYPCEKAENCMRCNDYWEKCSYVRKK